MWGNILFSIALLYQTPEMSRSLYDKESNDTNIVWYLTVNGMFMALNLILISWNYENEPIFSLAPSLPLQRNATKRVSFSR